ncbi:MAG: CDP-glycerol glycerophosphotransferase family protein [Bacillota bacterium]|nr:CDP-glycerol glycerophosphotransferase family protein [Bacillota bacterium]
MVREIAISLYLLAFKCIFLFFKLFPLKDKVTFVISFGDNSKYVFEEMQRQPIKHDVVFLCTGKSIATFNDYEYVTRIPFETFNVFMWMKGIFHLATSRKIMVDNYFGFLAAIDFKEEVKCFQLWHASGAIKKFGLEDGTVKNRSVKARERFLRVYDKFDKVIVGSDTMATIFLKAFNLKSDRILKTGIPRTDFFFDEKKKQKILESLTLENPLLGKKKVLLYAPTYRDNELDQFQLQLDLKKMNQELGDQYILMLRLHPAIRKSVDVSKMYPGFAFDYSSNQYQINDLLLAADYLITDYSSIPFEFSLLRKPMIFFTYDFEQYKRDRGILEESFPGPVANDTNTIIHLLKEDRFDLNVVDQYAKKWNKYSNGQSSRNLVHYMFEGAIPKVLEQRAL